MEELREKSTEEIIQLYSGAIKELKRREVIRTNNVVGELGEYLAITHYNNTPGLPNLSPAPVCTENIDAISRKGDRYSIKSTSNTKRLVLHGVRKDVYDVLTGSLNTKELPLLPEATYSKEKKKGFKRWRTVQETIMDLPEIQAGEDAKNVNIANHVARKLSKTNQNRLDNIRKNGGDRRSVSAELQLECHKKENVSYTDTYGVISLDRPAPTITSGCTIISKGRYGHPTQNRGLSVREAARLQSFDDKFIFVGNIGEMSLQIGNAVPPKLAQASAKEIIKYMKLFEENTKEDDNREVITI